MANKKYIIEITDTDVYINGELQFFSTKMDKADHDADLAKKAIVALGNEMGYETTFLLEEIVDRMYEMLDEEED